MVTDYLKQALYAHPAVAVSGLGLFTTKDSSDPTQPQHLLMPHSLSLSFEATKSGEDLLLAQTIASGENITIAEAEREIIFFVAEVKNQLDAEGSYELAGLGTFSGSSSSFSFAPLPELNLAEDSYGLPALELPNAPVAVEPEAKPVQSQPAHQYEPALEEEPKKKGISVVSVLLWVLVIGCLATGGTILYLQLGRTPVAVEETDADGGVVFGRKTKPKEGHADEVTAEATVPEAEEEVVMGENAKPATTSPSTAKPSKQEEAPAQAPPPSKPAAPVSAPAVTKPAKPTAASSEQVYHIIVGSFGVPDNAYNLSKTLASKGFETQVLDPKPGKKLYRVSVGQFDTEQEAKTFIAQHQKDFKETLYLQKP